MDHFAGFEPDISFSRIAVARIFQAAGLAFLFVPINMLAYANLPEGKSNNASALINLMRNLGGSVGISVGTTLLARRSQIHQDRLVSHLTPTSIPFHERWHALAVRLMAHGLDSVTATKRALAIIYKGVQTQASMLSYLDTFKVLMYCSFGAAVLTLFLRRIDLSKAKAH